MFTHCPDTHSLNFTTNNEIRRSRNKRNSNKSAPKDTDRLVYHQTTSPFNRVTKKSVNLAAATEKKKTSWLNYRIMQTRIRPRGIVFPSSLRMCALQRPRRDPRLSRGAHATPRARCAYATSVTPVGLQRCADAFC